MVPATEPSEATSPVDILRRTNGPLSPQRLVGAALGLLAVAVLAVLWGKEAASFLQENLGTLTEWVQAQGIWGPIFFAAGYVAAALLMVPGSLLTASAGFVFGLTRGTLLVLIAATVGASLSFILGRTLVRGAIERRLVGHRRFAAIDRAISKEGLKIVMLLRLSPIFPFSLLNYGLGLTGVRFRDYLLGCVAMAPGTFLYVYYGYTAKNLADLAAGGGRLSPGQWALLGIGLAATAAVTALITRIARSALQEATAMNSPEG